jgi:hypothetical protein
MKLTGLLLVIVGLGIGVYCGFVAAFDGPSDTKTTSVIEKSAGPNLTAPAIVAGAAMVCGVGLMLFGNRGVIVTQDPHVRN